MQFNRHLEFRVQIRVQIRDKLGDKFSTKGPQVLTCLKTPNFIWNRFGFLKKSIESNPRSSTTLSGSNTRDSSSSTRRSPTSRCTLKRSPNSSTKACRDVFTVQPMSTYRSCSFIICHISIPINISNARLCETLPYLIPFLAHSDHCVW